MGCFASEDVVAESDINEDQRQHNHRADQQQRLWLGCGCCLTERNFKGYHVRPYADRNAHKARQKYSEAQQKRALAILGILAVLSGFLIVATLFKWIRGWYDILGVLIFLVAVVLLFPLLSPINFEKEKEKENTENKAPEEEVPKRE